MVMVELYYFELSKVDGVSGPTGCPVRLGNTLVLSSDQSAFVSWNDVMIRHTRCEVRKAQNPEVIVTRFDH